MKYIIYLILELVLFIVSTGFVYGENISKLTYSIKTDSAAIVATLEHMGFQEVRNSFLSNNSDIGLVKVDDVHLPYLSNLFDSEELWKIKLKNISLDRISKTRKNRNLPPVNMEIILEPEMGRLLKVSSKLRDTIFDVIHPNTPTEAKNILKKRGYNYIGLPEKISIPLIKVLNGCPIDITEAIEFEAFYILCTSITDSIPRPLWQITLYGYPYMPHPPPAPEESGRQKTKVKPILSTCHIVIDGITGETMTVSGTGKPE